ncbi:MAG: excisionase family DNA binding protein [Oleiphilaceae bacterium]|jgi:excisionase family DNA binding protein
MDTIIKLINITYLWLLIPLFSHILSNSYLVDIKMTDEILTLKEMADYLKLAEKTAYRLAAEGKLPGFKVGGSWRFKKEDILQWIEDKKASNKSS